LTKITTTTAKHFVHKTKQDKQSFKQKYGEGWVILTGFTNGLGW